MIVHVQHLVALINGFLILGAGGSFYLANTNPTKECEPSSSRCSSLAPPFGSWRLKMKSTSCFLVCTPLFAVSLYQFFCILLSL